MDLLLPKRLIGRRHPRRVRHVYDKPVPTMRRYLDGVYEDPSNVDDWPVVIAALGPLMLKLAAERTAGAVPYNVTPEHTRGARAALGPDKLLAVEQKVCLRRTRRRRAASPGESCIAIQLSQQLATFGLHRSRPREWRFGQIDRCDGALGRSATIISGLRAHLAAGATQLCIQPVPAEGDMEARDRTLTALADV